VGRTLVDVKVENFADLYSADLGLSPRKKARSVRVKARVDTGTTVLCLPKRLINKLGLIRLRARKAITANGEVQRDIHGVAQITVLGRDCRADVMEIPDNVPILLGYVPLENLDLVVDAKANKVIPNPAHGGKFVLDLL